MEEKKIRQAFLKIKQDIESLRREIFNIKNKNNEKDDKKQKIIVTSGYFDPLHKGHIECFQKAKALGGKLIVILNSDEQAIKKKGYVFMPQADRIAVIKSLKPVDEVFLSIDKDLSVCESLRFLNPDIFAKGGDRTKKEVPEAKICKELGIKMIDGLGKKVQSSSELVEKSRLIEKKSKNAKLSS